MKTDEVRVPVHTHKKLACTASISTVHEQILLKFEMLVIDDLTSLKIKMTSPKNENDLTHIMKMTSKVTFY